jgi:hypothetical protein
MRLITKSERPVRAAPDIRANFNSCPSEGAVGALDLAAFGSFLSGGGICLGLDAARDPPGFL